MAKYMTRAEATILGCLFVAITLAETRTIHRNLRTKLRKPVYHHVSGAKKTLGSRRTSYVSGPFAYASSRYSHGSSPLSSAYSYPYEAYAPSSPSPAYPSSYLPPSSYHTQYSDQAVSPYTVSSPTSYPVPAPYYQLSSYPAPSPYQAPYSSSSLSPLASPQTRPLSYSSSYPSTGSYTPSAAGDWLAMTPVKQNSAQKNTKPKPTPPDRTEIFRVQGRLFKSIGCWADSSTQRAMDSLEGTNDLLKRQNYKARVNALMKCAEVAADNEYKLFALQNGGQCFGGRKAENTFRRYGASVDCEADGEGGPWSNEVYSFLDPDGNPLVSPPKAMDVGNAMTNGTMNSTCGTPPQGTGQSCVGVCPPANCLSNNAVPNVTANATGAPSSGNQTKPAGGCNSSGPAVTCPPQVQQPGICGGAGMPCPFPGPLTGSPAAPAAPVTPAQLVPPVAPIAPVPLAAPAALVAPVAPMSQAAPAAPVPPAAPAAPIAPVAPVAPAAPAVPAAPATPITAASPSVPAIPVVPTASPGPISGVKIECAGAIGGSCSSPIQEAAPSGNPGLGTGTSCVIQGKVVEGCTISPPPAAVPIPPPPPALPCVPPMSAGSCVPMLPPSTNLTGGTNVTGPTANQTGSANASRAFPSPRCKAKVDLGIVIDASGSIENFGKGNFKKVLAFVQGLVQGFKVSKDETHVGIIVFDTNPQVISNLDQHYSQNQILSTIGGINYNRFGRGTNIGKALQMAQSDLFNNSARPGVPNVLVVMTDGRSTDEVKEPAQKLRDAGVTIFAVGLGSEFDSKELEDIATDPDSQHLLKANFNNMKEITSTIVDTACLGAGGATQAPPVSSLRKPPGTAVADIKCTANVDIGILLDGSTSVDSAKPGNFKKCLDFLKNLVQAFNIAKDGTHVGIVVYSSSPKRIFDLDQFMDAKPMLREINTIKYPGGGTRTGEGLDMVRKDLFLTSGRQVKQILLVMTDGASQDEVDEPSKKLRDMGVTIFSLGIGNGFMKDQLDEMATDPDSKHVFTGNFEELEKILPRIKQAACQAAGGSSTTTPPNGGGAGGLGAGGARGGRTGMRIRGGRWRPGGRRIRQRGRRIGQGGRRRPRGRRRQGGRGRRPGWGRPGMRIRQGGRAGGRIPGAAGAGGARAGGGGAGGAGAGGAGTGGGGAGGAGTVGGGGGAGGAGAGGAGTVGGGAGAGGAGTVGGGAGAGGAGTVGGGAGAGGAGTVGGGAGAGGAGAGGAGTVGVGAGGAGTVGAGAGGAGAGGAGAGGAGAGGAGAGGTGTVGGGAGGAGAGGAVGGAGECKVKVDLGIVIDSSGSIQQAGPDNYKKIKELVKAIVRGFNVTKDGSRVGVIIYDNSPKVISKFDQHEEEKEILTEIDRMPYLGGGTNTGQAIRMAKSDLFDNTKRPGVPRFLLIVTDGKSRDDIEGPSKDLKKSDVTIFAVGVGTNFNMGELQTMATDPDSSHVITEDFSKVGSIVSKLVGVVCTDARNPANKGSDFGLNGEEFLEGENGETDNVGMSEGGNKEGTDPQAGDIGFDGDAGNDTYAQEGGDTGARTGDIDFDGGAGNDTYAQERQDTDAEKVGLEEGGGDDGADAAGEIQFDDDAVNDSDEQRGSDERGGPAEGINEGTEPGDDFDAEAGIDTDVKEGTDSGPANNSVKGRGTDKGSDVGRGLERGGGAEEEEPTGGTGRGAGGNIASSPGVEAGVPIQQGTALGRVGRVTGPKPVRVTTAGDMGNVVKKGVQRTLDSNSYIRGTGIPTPDNTRNPLLNDNLASKSILGVAGICKDKVDLAFLIDASGNKDPEGEANFKTCLEFVKAVSSMFVVNPLQTHVGFVVFSSNSQVVLNLKTYFDATSVANALDAIPYVGGQTNIAAGLKVAKTQLFDTTARPNIPHILIVITAGKSFDDVSIPSKELRDAGVTVFSVGIGNNVNLKELNDMATDPDVGHVLTANVKEFSLVVKKIQSEVCKANIRPVALYPLNAKYLAKDVIGGNPAGERSLVIPAVGPGNKDGGSLSFLGTQDSFIEFPNNGRIDAKESLSLLAWIFPEKAGPIFNFKRNGWGANLWLAQPRKIFAHFVDRRHRKTTLPLQSTKIIPNRWNYIGATYDHKTGEAGLWVNGKFEDTKNIGTIELATNYTVRMGARIGDKRNFRGRISCMQVYNVALTSDQIEDAKENCKPYQ